VEFWELLIDLWSNPLGKGAITALIYQGAYGRVRAINARLESKEEDRVIAEQKRQLEEFASDEMLQFSDRVWSMMNSLIDDIAQDPSYSDNIVNVKQGHKIIPMSIGLYIREYYEEHRKIIPDTTDKFLLDMKKNAKSFKTSEERESWLWRETRIFRSRHFGKVHKRAGTIDQIDHYEGKYVPANQVYNMLDSILCEVEKNMLMTQALSDKVRREYNITPIMALKVLRGLFARRKQ